MQKTQQKESKFIPVFLITISILFLFIMLIMPLVVVITEALRNGIEVYKKAVFDTYTLKALLLTLEATLAAVAVNTVFGLFAAWTVTKYQFRKKKLLTTLIDIPFAISPIIAGLIFILTFGRIGWTHGLLTLLDIKIVFAVPGVILGTVFVTFPFISREIIPVLNAQGSDQEEAAAIMGAGAFRIFRRITFPQIKWAFLYGVVLCTARAMGEFGAVSVLSGHLRGKTITLPLQVEIFFSEFNFTAAFAVSSMLVILAVILLIIRNILEYKMKKAGV
ncbi:sulfate ABC transporter permease subunit CysW [Anaerocolumna sp. AGMB13020]|uniref:sulfate ABC transporter permease subunit CysW n=1 Tax=Anaerocolumna sp. AGMB13020 TaxID=3081750 RepID=UPI002953DEDA|nr:sulfate ABC transporter permease subunit CysW [Anaerocolumna sp. AGMB13020]WOO37061.1 sulfate ABC transporter permease subunit CysW [Anaerocolumna sp. AGMB13020]